MPDPVFSFDPDQPRGPDGRWLDGAAGGFGRPPVHDMTEEDFRNSPPAGYAYDPQLPHEADVHSRPGTITLGPKFFQISDADSRANVVTHEIGHDLSDRMLDDGEAFRLIRQGAYTSRFVGPDGVERLAMVHDNTPGENAAQSYAELVHSPDEFRERFPHAHRATAERAVREGFPVPAAALAPYPDLAALAARGERPPAPPVRPEEDLLHDIHPDDARTAQLAHELVALGHLRYDRAARHWAMDGRTAATAGELVKTTPRSTTAEERSAWNAEKLAAVPATPADHARRRDRERAVARRESELRHVAPWLVEFADGFDDATLIPDTVAFGWSWRWNPFVHPRAPAGGADGGQFVLGETGSSGASGANDPDPLPGPRGGAPTPFARGIASAMAATPPPLAAFRHQALSRVLSAMPPTAHERAAKATKQVVFHDDAKVLTEHVLRDRPDLTPAERSERVKLLTEFRAGRFGGAAGAYDSSEHELHLAGSPVQKPPLLLHGDATFDPAAYAVQTYAHEIMHAVDGPDSEISTDPEWFTAWRAEIKLRPLGGQRFDVPLSPYADEDPSEGLAELGAALYGKVRTPKELEARFPRCAAVLRRYDLWPD